MYILAATMIFLLKNSTNGVLRRVSCLSHIKANSTKFFIRANSSSVPVFNPFFVTGFCDAEACFFLQISKKAGFTGWGVRPTFHITLHKKDKVLLESIQASLGGVGGIYKQGKDSVQLIVFSLADINNKIIPHFERYPLITQKRVDYEGWKEVINLMNSKQHLTIEGLDKIVGIKTFMNRGISKSLQLAFPNVSSIEKPVFVNQGIIDPNWIAGFTSGDGSFIINTYKTSRSRLGMEIRLEFKLTQDLRDAELLRSFVNYFNAGGITLRPTALDFRVTGFADLVNKIIPFFDKYCIEGVKAKDYADFKLALEIMKEKGHLTIEGLDELIKIKTNMNTGRAEE